MKRETKTLFGVAAILLVALPLLATTALAQMPANMLIPKAQMQNSPTLGGQQPIPSNPNLNSNPLWRWILGFLNQASKVQLQGTLSAYRGNEIVLTTSTGTLTIMLPQKWYNDTDIISLQTVFKNGCIKKGSSITMMALQRTSTNTNGVTISVLVGYDIKTTDKHFSAVLPFNIS